MVDFKKDSWFYALIAAILALIAILTPWGTAESGFGFDITGWLTGAVQYWGDPADMWVGAGLQAWTFGLTMMSIAALLLLSSTRKVTVRVLVSKTGLIKSTTPLNSLLGYALVETTTSCPSSNKSIGYATNA